MLKAMFQFKTTKYAIFGFLICLAPLAATAPNGFAEPALTDRGKACEEVVSLAVRAKEKRLVSMISLNDLFIPIFADGPGDFIDGPFEYKTFNPHRGQYDTHKTTILEFASECEGEYSKSFSKSSRSENDKLLFALLHYELQIKRAEAAYQEAVSSCNKSSCSTGSGYDPYFAAEIEYNTALIDADIDLAESSLNFRKTLDFATDIILNERLIKTLESKKGGNGYTRIASAAILYALNLIRNNIDGEQREKLQKDIIQLKIQKIALGEWAKQQQDWNSNNYDETVRQITIGDEIMYCSYEKTHQDCKSIDVPNERTPDAERSTVTACRIRLDCHR